MLRLIFSLLFLREKKKVIFLWTKVKQIPTEPITHIQEENSWNLCLPLNGCPSEKLWQSHVRMDQMEL